ncbi:hypothetical protein C8J57DRAFT_1471634 [Mycena rebaudengoi]|nr:hypothetical protein C8J57DRAFT_1471634 [Mycena rebaudengoi]
MRSQIIFAALYALQASAVSWTTTPFNPPSIPLAVRSPYLSTWLPQGGGSALNDGWPSFTFGATLGWVGLVKVDGQTYNFLGGFNTDSTKKAVQKSFKFTTTQSIFVLSAGPVDLTVTFLSPVEADEVKLSIPLSYMDVSAVSTDGAAHSVQVYSDISGEWTSGSATWDIEWSTTTTDILSHEIRVAFPAVYEEINDQTQYGAAYYSILNGKKATYQTGPDAVVRNQFVNKGLLTNTKDLNFRSISDSWPIFGLSKDLGSVSKTPASVVFSVGHIRDPAVKYVIAPNTHQARSLYFWSKFSTADKLISFFLNDYSKALATANTLDKRVETDAGKISADYAAIVALSVRQALAATELTISKGRNGQWNTSDTMYFMKEVSSNGNTNTVDVMFPASPLYLYLFPKLGHYLLEPLYRYQASGQYPRKNSIHDMGAHYPKAIGHADGLDESMPVEESGNMLIMALGFARATKDKSQLIRYKKLLEQWTEFLITDSLIPAHQLSTDDFAGTLENQTNLAIKGIIGIGAMGEISKLLGEPAKAANYTRIARDYVAKWQVLAQSATGPHLTLSYGQSESWGLAYNLYSDKHLKLNLFPESVYQMQTAWYKQVTNEYGVPLDTRHTYTKSDWEMWTAAILTDTTLRDTFISRLKNYLTDSFNNMPFSDWYDTVSGRSVGFRARPVAGGHLALLTL